MSQIERSLVIFKPDAVQRGIVGEILTRFERVGLKIVGTKMASPDAEHYAKHYEEIGKLKTRIGETVYNNTLEMMAEGPVIAVVLEGVEAAALIRKLVGSTEPKSSAPGTIRGDYSHVSYAYSDAANKALRNIIHASGDADEAKQEIALWFADDELFDYSVLNEKFTR
jgi:nucleoside-diphosphate kinase